MIADPKEKFETSKLKDNFKSLIKKWSDLKVPPADLLELLKKIPTTHTFAFEKNWGNDTRFPYKDILFTNQALLSDIYRLENGLYKDDEPRRGMEEARKDLLAYFVFAYLGTHDHFYSTSRKNIATPAFGVFLPKHLDYYPLANGSRRDLSSPECNVPKENEFMNPEDARTYAAYQIKNDTRHGGDFWHYWGNANYYEKEKNYAKKNWEWKIEFHYFEQVELKEIQAIIFPIKTIKTGVNTSIIDPEVSSEIEKFKKIFPEKLIYLYSWDPVRAFNKFTLASSIITSYFVNNGDYPSTDYFAKEFNSVYIN